MNRAVRRLLALGGRIAASRGSRSGHRDVLFAAQGAMMAGHLARVYRTIRDLPGVRPFLVLPSRAEKVRGEYERARSLLPIPEVSDARAHLRPWDVVVVADHGYFRDIVGPGRQVNVYVGHHSTSKKPAGQDRPYPISKRAYGTRGRIRYTRIFEASDFIRERMLDVDPSLEEVVVVVGRIEQDVLLALAGDRDAARFSLGFEEKDRVVLVMGTWGEGSLFRLMGPELIEQAERLRESYRFVFTVHAHEYRPVPGGGLAWGPRLLALRDRGFLVREPWDDPDPYLVACDAVVTDHTSLAHSAALLGKPAVYAPVPEEQLWDGSVTRRYRDLSVKLDDPGDLGPKLERALDHPPTDDLTALSREINSCPGDARRRIRAEFASLLGIDLSA